jgi:quercetin dioxygenase-like cupin family protein
MYSKKTFNEIKEEDIPVGQGVSRKILIGAEEAPNFAMRSFSIAPGGSMPMHTNSVEHEQFVLQGKAEVHVGDDVFTVQRQDVVFIPAGTPHNYRNIGDEPFTFLCLVPNKEDIIEVVE